MAGHQRTADTPASGGQAGAILRMGTHHTCLRHGEREDTEGAPTWRQGRCINNQARFEPPCRALLIFSWLTGGS